MMRNRSCLSLSQNKLGNHRHPNLSHNRFGNQKLIFQNQNKSGNQNLICQNETFKMIQDFIKRIFQEDKFGWSRNKRLL
ncbi:hypothetical protein Hanom_Chr06g00557821 [Helianthus anomalus]